jgi:MIP family channel proteins
MKNFSWLAVHVSWQRQAGEWGKGLMNLRELKQPETMRAVVAEALGTFAFIFLVTGTAVASANVTGGGLDAARLLTIAIAFGVSIAAVVAATARISGGHINPAVTVAALVTGKIGKEKAVAYILAQLVGAVVASGLLRAIVPAVMEYGLGANGIGPAARADGFTELRGFAMEVSLTFFFVWVIFAVAVDKRGPGFPLAPIAIGMTLFVVHLVGIPFTTVSVNPARTFGPALIAGEWDAHWIYWLGPLIGGALAALVYQYVFGERGKAGG